MAPAPKPWWFAQMNIEQVWNTYSEQGAHAKVAVLDTGYDLANTDVSAAVQGTSLFMQTQNGMNDMQGHGTHCTSLIAGRNKNAITGCAPLATVISGKITEDGSYDSDASMIAGIKWAIEQKPDIISISSGLEDVTPDLGNAVNAAVTTHNILVIASIGDYNKFRLNKYYPALYPDCIAVGGTTEAGTISTYSVADPKTEIYAPGENILAYTLKSAVNPLTGTSQSTAIVAGICALAISALKAKNKAYTVNDIKQLLVSTADPFGDNGAYKLINPVKLFEKL